MIAPTVPVRKIATASKRKQKIPEPVMAVEEEEEDDDEEEEEEEDEQDESITRCVCGESHSLGLMVCCDQCEVWQHCECMGLEKDEIPDEYFCELCRPSDHIEVKSYDKTRRYYKPCLPVSAEIEAASDKRTVKRRTTFNSREASISLEEVLAFRNAIEQSKNYDASGMEFTASQVQVQHYDAMHTLDENITIVQNYDTQQEHQAKRPKRASPKKSTTAEEQVKPNKREKKTQRRYTPRSATSNSHFTASPNTATTSAVRRHTNKDSRSRTSTPQPELQTPTSATSNNQIFEHFSPFARESTPPAKVRLPSQRATIAEMNKRASQILEYICSMQVELATKRNRHDGHSDSEEDDEGEVCKRRQLVSAKINQVMTSNAFVGAGADDNTHNEDSGSSPKKNRRPTPILIPGKLDHSSPSSSLSSASTIPLDDVAYQHEKSVAQEALEKSSSCAKEQSSMEIMDNLTRKVITFQRRFGSLGGFNMNNMDEDDGPVTRSSHHSRW
ncbi:uncharacterized protein ATC70_001885 [Mucor velutinosus]|uniref:Zinc finger PHD-type domain-containing protein n=1 Tax=Mucor velutinosus TaxID=708070 RepID=A0AAN7DBJ2_9FUNG|nr:hypothetical protein ATC70_001885 [Mucor velutinosus]